MVSFQIYIYIYIFSCNISLSIANKSQTNILQRKQSYFHRRQSNTDLWKAKRLVPGGCWSRFRFLWFNQGVCDDGCAAATAAAAETTKTWRFLPTLGVPPCLLQLLCFPPHFSLCLPLLGLKTCEGKNKLKLSLSCNAFQTCE